MRARKRFGQHFLTDEGVLERISGAMQVSSDDRLLEIGPGHGALTQLLAGAPAVYKAVEIDRDLVPLLRATYPSIEIINQDILRVDLEDVLPNGGAWRVFGNLPYNISSPLIAHLTEFVRDHPGRIRDMHFMLQKEMAERLFAVAGTKAWGRLSVMVQLFFDVMPVCDVAPDSFSPPPKVWSTVVRMIPRQDRAAVDVDALDRVLRLAFAARRKRLSNALRVCDLDWSRIDVDPGRRPDDLGLDEYVQIANEMAHRERESRS